VTVHNKKSSPSITVIYDLYKRIFRLPLHTILQCAESLVLLCPAIKLHISDSNTVQFIFWCHRWLAPAIHNCTSMSQLWSMKATILI